MQLSIWFVYKGLPEGPKKLICPAIKKKLLTSALDPNSGYYIVNVWFTVFQSISMLRSVYKSVHDIDLYIGLLHEKKDLEDAVVGKTFR